MQIRIPIQEKNPGQGSANQGKTMPVKQPPVGIVRQKTASPFQAQKNLVERNLAGVKKIIAVHSGKGGVGKSFFAVNLAVAFAQKGMNAGVVDADVDCPSCHKLLGSRKRVIAGENGRLIPLESHGIRFLSVGNMVDSEDDANIMRGPIMFKLVFDMLANAEWERLDLLVVDLPPGTGDNPLTVMQLVPLAGLVVVTQPQEVALVDCRKSISMAKKMGVKVLGVAENMSGKIFGEGGAKSVAEQQGIEFLGSIPLQENIRRLSDAGVPPVLEDYELMEKFLCVSMKCGFLAAEPRKHGILLG